MFTKKLLYPVVFLVIILVTYLTKTENNQSIGYTYPYCSGAANLDFSLKWKIDPDEYSRVSKMSHDEYRSHRHIVSDNPIINEHNNFGYVFVVFAARTLFFWLGDLNAVILLQVLVHAFISVSVMRLLSSKLLAAVFFFFYSVNPFVSHFVTFPFYYFWAVIPSYFFLLLFFRKKTFTYELLYLLPLLYLSFVTRPTTILIIFLFFIYQIMLDKSKFRLPGLISLLVFCTLTFFLSAKPSTLGRSGQESAVWHTAYIGIGAYPNNYDIQLSDEFAFSKYYEETGIEISTNPVDGSLTNLELKNEYYRWLKEKYFSIVENDKWLVIKNAVLNSIAAFSFGYFVEYLPLTMISCVFGLFVLIFLFYRREYLLTVAIFVSSCTYTFYYPPIQAYNFGTFLMVALAISYIFHYVISYFKRLFNIGSNQG